MLRGEDRHPIVLLHGLSGFRALGGEVEYFFQVPGDLRAAGHEVYVTSVPPWAPVEVRAEHLGGQLKAILARSGARKLHLLAHSMGGLDARYAISMLGYAPMVASLTTVGTPHRGSPLADTWLSYRVPLMDGLRDGTADLYAWALGDRTGRSNTAATVLSLTVQAAERFNATVRNDPAVRYYSFAGRTMGHRGDGFCDDAALPNPPGVDYSPPELTSSALFLGGPDPVNPIANDGMVQVPSAKWGRWMGCAPANHIRLVGHYLGVRQLPGAWDHLEFYRRWAALLVSGEARRF